MSKLSKLGKAIQEKQKNQPENPSIKLNPKEKINFYLTNIQQKIIHQIDQQKQSISSKKVLISQIKSPFFEDSNTITIKKKQQELIKLNDQKSKAERKLKMLSDKQFQLQQQYRMKLKNQYFNKNGTVTDRTNMGNKTIQVKNVQKDKNMENQFLENQFMLQNLSSSKVKSLNKFRPKSQLTTKDVQTLKHLKKEYNKFQEQVSLKTFKHNQQLEKIKKQNQQLQYLLKKQRTNKRRNQIEIKLKDLQIQKEERIKKFQEEKKNLDQAKRKPKRFEKILKDFEIKQRSFQQQKIDQMKERLKKKLLDATEINQHQRRYQQIRSQQLKQIEQKYLEQSRLLKESKIQPPSVSRFYLSVLKEQKERKVQRKRKELATIEKCQRIKQYASKVHQEFAPRLRTKQNEEEDGQKPEQYNDKSLSIEQQKRLGNNYLKEAIKDLKQHQKPKSSKTINQGASQSAQLPKIMTNSNKYKDYLSEERNRYPSSFQRQKAKQQKSRLRYNHSVDEVKKIMSQQFNDKNKYQTIQKIKQIAQKLEHDPNDRNYLDKIKIKLQILQTIT